MTINIGSLITLSALAALAAGASTSPTQARAHSIAASDTGIVISTERQPRA